MGKTGHRTAPATVGIVIRVRLDLPVDVHSKSMDLECTSTGVLLKKPWYHRKSVP